MKKIIYINVKTLTLCFSILFFLSCAKEDLGDLNNILYVRHKGADMPAYIHGNASEKVFLIILHGGPGGSGLEYRSGSIKNEIEKSCAVVYFDQRGSGMSQGRYSEDGINIDIMAEDVVALVKVIQRKYGADSRFFLMGHSWGGTLGTATLLHGTNQNLFKGWIEVDGGHDLKQLYFENINYFKIVAEEQIAAQNNLAYWNGVSVKINQVDDTQYNERDGDYMNEEAFKAEEILLSDMLLDSPREDFTSFGNTVFRNNPLTTWWSGGNTNGVLSDQGIWENISYTNRLHEITIPSLLLWGKYDMVIPPKMGEDAYDNLGSDEKKFVLFERSGHSPMDNEADKFANEVIGFLDSNK